MFKPGKFLEVKVIWVKKGCCYLLYKHIDLLLNIWSLLISTYEYMLKYMIFVESLTEWICTLTHISDEWIDEFIQMYMYTYMDKVYRRVLCKECG